MIRQGVLIRGTNEGITVYLHEECEFVVILSELRDKFTNAHDFFRGASISINSGERSITPEEKMALIDLCQDYELSGVEFVTRPEVQNVSQKDPWITEGETLILKKTLRSGQRVTYKGNIIIIGDVNPGAQVIAVGDVAVMGNLRGVVHAGAQGNTDAEVFALALQPTQLRIAHCIARSPDGFSVKKKRRMEPEKASIKEGIIVIECIED